MCFLESPQREAVWASPLHPSDLILRASRHHGRPPCEWTKSCMLQPSPISKHNIDIGGLEGGHETIWCQCRHDVQSKCQGGACKIVSINCSMRGPQRVSSEVTIANCMACQLVTQLSPAHDECETHPLSEAARRGDIQPTSTVL